MSRPPTSGRWPLFVRRRSNSRAAGMSFRVPSGLLPNAASELPCQSPRQPANHSPQECNTWFAVESQLPSRFLGIPKKDRFWDSRRQLPARSRPQPTEPRSPAPTARRIVKEHRWPWGAPLLRTAQLRVSWVSGARDGRPKKLDAHVVFRQIMRGPGRTVVTARGVSFGPQGGERTDYVWHTCGDRGTDHGRDWRKDPRGPSHFARSARMPGGKVRVLRAPKLGPWGLWNH